MEILQNFVAFSEYMNFITLKSLARVEISNDFDAREEASQSGPAKNEKK